MNTNTTSICRYRRAIWSGGFVWRDKRMRRAVSPFSAYEDPALNSEACAHKGVLSSFPRTPTAEFGRRTAPESNCRQLNSEDRVDAGTQRNASRMVTVLTGSRPGLPDHLPATSQAQNLQALAFRHVVSRRSREPSTWKHPGTIRAFAYVTAFSSQRAGSSFRQGLRGSAVWASTSAWSG